MFSGLMTNDFKTTAAQSETVVQYLSLIAQYSEVQRECYAKCINTSDFYQSLINKQTEINRLKFHFNILNIAESESGNHVIICV